MWWKIDTCSREQLAMSSYEAGDPVTILCYNKPEFRRGVVEEHLGNEVYKVRRADGRVVHVDAFELCRRQGSEEGEAP